MIATLARLIENSSRRVACLLILLSAFPLYASGEDFIDSIHAYLQRYVDAEKIKCGIVVGLIDEHGSNIVSCGKMDNGTDQDVNGDTLFELGSITKTFTGLLLEDMVQRGQMSLDGAVAKYLPDSVTVPSRNSKEITLRHLVTHTSGLPREPDNLDPRRAESPGANYTVEKLYGFLAGYKLTREPGAEFEYSSLGIGLLAQAIALKAGTDYETFMGDRICRPLAMDSTRITLTPELKSRFAAGHSQPGYMLPSPDFGSLAPAGALCSTANDMLKYLSANLGLAPSRLTPVMEKTHEVHYSQQQPEIDIGLAWVISRDPQGTEIIWHNGATYGSLAFVGFEKARHRGVVVLCNSRGVNDILDLGRFLLECEWQSDHRSAKTTIDLAVDDDYVGDYRYSPDSSQKPLGMWRVIAGAPKAAVFIPVLGGFALLVVFFWRAGNMRNRSIILGCALLFSGPLAAIMMLTTSHAIDTPFQPSFGIRREGNQLFAQTTGTRSWPVDGLVPPIAGELLPESESRFVERLGAAPITFSRDSQGHADGLTALCRGVSYSFKKISDEPPTAPDSPRRPIVAKLDTKILDACVGRYEFAPSAKSSTGVKLAIWRNADQLIAQFWGANVTPGAIDIYPESEATFFLTIDGTQLSFKKNDQGEVTAVIHHVSGLADFEGKRLKNE